MKFIHEKALVDPGVKIGENSSVWAFAVLRNDEGPIKIGKNTSIQEHCILHGAGVTIGDNVTVGHGAIIHGAKIGNNVLIGMNAVLLNNCEVGDWCIIAAGTTLTPGTKIPANSLVTGTPGQVKRALTEKDTELIEKSYKLYLEKLEKIKKQNSAEIKPSNKGEWE